MQLAKPDPFVSYAITQVCPHVLAPWFGRELLKLLRLSVARPQPGFDHELAIMERGALMKNFLISTLCLVCIACANSDSTNMEKARQAYEKKDYATAFPLYVKLANKGDAYAQVQIGAMHFNGWGTKANKKEAATWYRKAAEQGNLAAINNLAGLLLKGAEGVPINAAEGIRWYEKCNNEHSSCFADHAYIYVYPRDSGVQVDYAKAARLFKRGVDLEIRDPKDLGVIDDKARSETGLAYLYEEGHGVEKNCDEAKRLFILSSTRNAPITSNAAKQHLDNYRC
jgi:TPR repeat protein